MIESSTVYKNGQEECDMDVTKKVTHKVSKTKEEAYVYMEGKDVSGCKKRWGSK